jgi:hypothetical protein
MICIIGNAAPSAPVLAPAVALADVAIDGIPPSASTTIKHGCIAATRAALVFRIIRNSKAYRDFFFLWVVFTVATV